MSTDKALSADRNRLTKGRMNSFNRHSMVDVSTSASVSARPNMQSRASSFLNFSFRGRPSSNIQQQPTLSPLHENIGNGTNGTNMNEFGAPRAQAPPQAQPSAPPRASLDDSSNANRNINMASSNASPPPLPPTSPPARQLHPEIRSIVQLSAAHAHKVYFSGPLVKHVERHSDGRIVGKEEPWREVWAQLGGTTLSVWDMKEIEEANKRGAEVPPAYTSITDASIHVLGAVTMPGPQGVPVKYSNVITLTTAGLNLLLFSCPSPQALVSWTAALRLAAYEKSRLEELYTAHLLRMSLSEQGTWKDPRCPLINGRLEGWVKIRINGQTDWKRLWMSAQAGREPEPSGGADAPRKNRVSSLFGRASHEHSNSTVSLGTTDSIVRAPLISLYSSPKPRDRRRPVISLGGVSQVFAVYPERPELISRSTLLKLEGFIGDEELAGEWRNREGWLLMMPETEPGKLGSLEMLKWLVGLHDAFALYGRPTSYTWNPRDPNSLMFAYPIGPRKDNLFLDRELAEQVDPREDRGSVVRQKFKDILVERMFGQEGASRTSLSMPPPATASGNGAGMGAPSLPPIPSVSEQDTHEQEPQHNDAPANGNASGNGNAAFQLPPLSFDEAPHPGRSPAPGDGGSLSPITERSYEQSRASTHEHANARSPPSATTSRSGSGGAAFSPGASARGGPMQATIEEEGILGGRRVDSPAGSAMSYDDRQSQQQQAGPSSPRLPEKAAPRFSQDSVSAPASAPGSKPGSMSTSEPARVTSPMSRMRSPPLSPHSEGSHYSTHGSDRLSVRPASNAQSSAMERESSLSVNVQIPDTPSSSSTSARVGLGMGTGLGIQNEHDQVPLSPASHISHSTVLTSPFSIVDGAGSVRTSFNKERDRDKDKDQERNGDGEQQPPMPPAKSPKRAQWEPQYKPRPREAEYIFDEPGALYYVEQQRQENLSRTPAATGSEQEEDEGEEDEEGSEHSVLTNPMSVNDSPQRQRQQQQQQQWQQRSAAAQEQQQPRLPSKPASPVARRQTPMGFEVVSGSVGVGQSTRSGRSGSLDTSSVKSGGGSAGGLSENQMGVPRTGLARRPSGARAPPPPPRVAGKRFLPSDTGSSSSMPLEVDEQPQRSTMAAYNTAHDDEDDDTVDALAALSFLEQQEDIADTPVRARAASPAADGQQKQSVNSSASPSALPPPQIMEPEDRAPSPPSQHASKQQYRSSFAPSRQAAERKARSQAQQAAHDAAVHKPGRPNGKQQRAKPRERGWESSEEEEEEEEDDDGNSDDEPRTASRPGSGGPSTTTPASRSPVYQQQVRGLSPSASGSAADIREQQNQQRPMRTLPQIPRGRSPAGSERRYEYEGPRDASIGRPQSQYPQQYQQQQQHPSASRQNMWSSVLDAGRDGSLLPPQNNNNRDTFVQMDSPSETMTKAFTPQGLLSAGLQDKQDRSAKRQEELARESGASLINVPNKPPPPQVGLLGAITAHERERKREGGVGATLTEREREKRLAEDRQRRLDELQRQQLEQQQQFAAQFGGGMGMYGGGGLSPQMTGMNPMMGGFGYPQMMGNPQSMYYNPMFNPMMGNPQHLYAAQQAAQAYQQAMVAMSAAGSQVGGEGGGAAAMGASVSPPMGMGMGGGSPAPNAMMGGGMGFDPRMSMMGMGMMGSPGMMGMGMPGMGSPMGMQVTGGSNMGGQPGAAMDARFSLGPGAFDSGLGLGQSPGVQSQRVSSYNGSPSPAPSPAPAPHTRAADVEPNSRA